MTEKMTTKPRVKTLLTREIEGIIREWLKKTFYYKETFTKQKQMHKHREQTWVVVGRGVREIIELTDMYTVLYLK